ncbi:MAG: cyclophilin-like fold protein [Thermodesulfovibrionales bacterium]
MADVEVRVGDVRLEAELFDTETAKAVERALPIEVSFEAWGDEFYFEVPVELGLDETATSRVKVGDIGYWPPGRAVAIFFGPTPMSAGDEPVPASDVNLIGRIKGDPRVLKSVKGAGKISIDIAV